MLLNAGNKWTFEIRDKGSIVDLTFICPWLVSDNNAWVVTNTFHLSDPRLIHWDVSTDRAKGVRSAERTNALKWKASVFDRELFEVALEKRPMNAKDTTEEVEKVMRRVTKARDSTMPRKRHENWPLSVYWWNDTIAAFRRKCI